jgi:hypothetical protein
MKNRVFIKLFFIPIFFLVSCFPLPGERNTAFFVKNTSNKPISFTSSVLKHSQTMGPHIIQNSFTVKPNDSILVRNIYFKSDGENPQAWFREFNIFPVDSIEMNNPKLAENWKKFNKEKFQYFTFTLNKK